MQHQLHIVSGIYYNSLGHYIIDQKCSFTVLHARRISAIPRTLEWRGLRCRRCREGGVWQGLCPSRKNIWYFLFKIPHLYAFWHVYFLHHTVMAEQLLDCDIDNCSKIVAVSLTVIKNATGYS